MNPPRYRWSLTALMLFGTAAVMALNLAFGWVVCWILGVPFT